MTPSQAPPLLAPEPKRLGLIIDVTLRILRRRWQGVLALALLFAGPGALLTAAAGLRFNSVAVDLLPGISDGVLGETPVLSADQLERLLETLAAYLAATLVAGLLGSVGAVALSRLVVAEASTGRRDLREALAVCLRRAPSVLIFALVTTLLVIGIAIAAAIAMSTAIAQLSSGAVARGGLGVFLALVIGVGTVLAVGYLTVRWALAFPVMAIEAAGWREALSRSWFLSGDNVWRIFFIVLVAGLASALLAALVSQLLAVVVVDVVAVAAGLDTNVAESIAIAIGTVLLTPLAPALLAVLYLDLRVRRDGAP